MITLLKKLLIEGKLTDHVFVGNKITDDREVEIWNEQDGDIPATYRKKVGSNTNVEIVTIKDVIIGFHILLDKERKSDLNLVAGTKQFPISYDVNFCDFISFLNNVEVSWKINLKESFDQRIVIQTASNIDFFFHLDSEDKGMFRIGTFDMELYNSYL